MQRRVVARKVETGLVLAAWEGCCKRHKREHMALLIFLAIARQNLLLPGSMEEIVDNNFCYVCQACRDTVVKWLG